MEIREFHALANDFLVLIRARTDEPNWQSAYSLLNHGEEEEAVDLLLAMLVANMVPVTRGEGETVRRLVGFFPLSTYDRGLYRYLTDLHVLDRLNVVDAGGTPT